MSFSDSDSEADEFVLFQKFKDWNKQRKCRAQADGEPITLG
jgi:hypothetical protein